VSKIIILTSLPDLSHRAPTDTAIAPFPLGVNPQAKQITESPLVETYVNQSVASNHTGSNQSQSWLARLSYKLAGQTWYHNLASPISRILVIESGERSEEVTKNFTDILNWDNNDIEMFLERMTSEVPKLRDGKLYPGHYIVAKTADAETVAIAIADRFNAEVRARYSDEIESIVPLTQTLIIASLLEREAYDFEDMRYISGVIWNRLFIDMRLQIDATMQYAKGQQASGNWWPLPVPEDKYIDSPYNTYKYAGLPPGPIANPSIDAIIAALNPRATDCLFYFHDEAGDFYCSSTYEEHVTTLKTQYGQDH
jgi:UPF0755 protein